MTLTDPFGLVHSIVDGRYRVERVVGQGGFGIVYRARHLGFDSPIALKVLRLPEDRSNERREARISAFQREGRVLFALSHLHASIVRAHETGRVRARDGSLAPYLALEWLDGVSLDAELKARRAESLPPLSLPSALHLLEGAAEGLARAHAAGVAHRDIKPGNLFIALRSGEQHIKILDFGVAKLVDAAVDTTDRFALTVGNTASFTPLYAAPEQWLERLGATGAWTDVHALALVLVELVSGRQPFSGRDSAQLMAACLDPLRPTPRACGVNVSNDVEAIFARALALEPRARFADAGAFWQALVQAAGWQAGKDEHALLELAARPATDAAANGTNATGAKSTLRLGGATATTAPSVSFARVTRAPAPGGSRLLVTATAAGAATMFVYGLVTRAPWGFGTPHDTHASTHAVAGATSTPSSATSVTSRANPTSTRGPLASGAATSDPLRTANPAATLLGQTPHVASSAFARRAAMPRASVIPAASPTSGTSTPASGTEPQRAASIVSASGGLVNVDDPALLRRK